MATYKHGVYTSETATSVKPIVNADAAIPIIVGLSPVNMGDSKNVNKPGIYYTRDEAVAACGYVPPKLDAASGLKKFEYSVSELIDSHFNLYAVAPIIVVNVLDPAKHKTSATTKTVTLDSKTGSATIAETGILPDSVKLGTGLTVGTDFIATFDSNGAMVITSLTDASGAFKCGVGEPLTFSADKLDPSAVTAEDIIGGVDVDGNKSGFELIDECFPRFRLIPGTILSPGFSGNATVAAVMAAKADSINEHFTAISLHDVPTDTVKKYSDVAAWKNTNNINDPKQVVCFPMIALDGVAYHMSTHLAGLMAKVDADNDNVPYVSPSNKNFEMTAAVLSDGTEVFLAPNIANDALNANGIVTAINFLGGWKCWGNRTACYPDNTDVKDAFIATRRMFNYVSNTLILNHWSKVDAPIKRRQVDSIVETANTWLNTLASAEQIYGGRVEFLESDNPDVNLMDGKMLFRLYLGAETPARSIEILMAYDASYFQNLFQ